ncbi:MAG: hypothetical protein HY898_22400 [Deltaproteobacteria bacterium]|nr:hypothetical protein [Deltaproteobacteria bacterium]
MRTIHATALVAACALGCSESTSVNPVAIPGSADAAPSADGGDASADLDAPVTPEAAPMRRQVLHRSPFGNLEQTGNLLFDGDFEWSSPGGQTAWTGFGQLGAVDMGIETGGLCRSGLRCAVIDNTYDVLGEAVAATHSGLQLSVWAKVPSTDCSVVEIYTLSLMLMAVGMQPPIVPDSPEPDGSGWCHYQGLIVAKDEAVGVFISASTIDDGQRVILDDVTLLASDGLSPLSVGMRPVPPAAEARMLAASDWLRRHRWVHRPERQIRIPWK